MAFELVAIGASWGGMAAIGTLLASLPEDFELPVVLAQHRGTTNEDLLEQTLARQSPLPVTAPNDKEPLTGGNVYVAPADYHVVVEPGHLALNTEPPVQFARPSIDVLFESAADAYGAGVVGVLLTGTNDDGARGLERIVAAGGFTLVQDPDEAERSEMPAAAIARGAARRVLPLAEIGKFLASLRHAVQEGGAR